MHFSKTPVETRGFSVAMETLEPKQRAVKEKPLMVTFSHPIEDHVNQDVSPTPAGSITAEREMRGRGGHTGESVIEASLIWRWGGLNKDKLFLITDQLHYL